MRKTSIKTLSLALSVLLAVTVLFSLTFFAGAEAEAALGDLNGDTLVNEDDIAILEAVLDGSQSADTAVNYDISGNRIVDFEDLTVLKNMVDPSQPALADKLADGTDDLLNLVSAVEGGKIQGAIVRGDSTRALKAEGNTITITFAQAQNWSGKTTLEMDVLWTTDKRTFTVTLLGVTEEAVTVKGNASQWGTVSVPVAGIAGEGVTGIRITVAEGAVAYFDNFAIRGESASSVTRQDLEKALMEVAWAYRLKGSGVQYDSTEFNTRGTNGSNSPLSKDYGGPWRTNTFSTLEDATADFNLYSVCSDYCWNVYYEALGYPVLGNRINGVTAGLFYNTSYPQNMAVLRWWDSGISSTVKSRLKTYNNGVMPTTTHTAEQVVDFFTNWEEYLRPGDIIVAHGNGGHQHAMLYVGNGYILHCGGGKFSMSTGKDDVELNGAIHLATVEGTFMDGSEQGGYFQINGKISDSNKYGAWLVVVRPLDVLTVADGDQDLSNDKLNTEYVLDVGKLELTLATNDLNTVPTTGFTITEATASRLEYPGMNIERTVDVKNYGTVAQGGTLTYTIKITNNSNNEDYLNGGGVATNYSGLKVTETVPVNTSYVSGNGTYANGKITWTVTLAAGESVELTYTVKATGEMGDKIVNGGGYVADIASNVLTTTIGGKKLEGTDASFVNKEASDWNSNAGNKLSANAGDGTSFAERVYNEWAGLDLELPTVQELAEGMFSEFELYQPYGLHTNHDKSLTRYMYKLNSADEVASDMRIYRDMLVEGFFGGVWVNSNDYNNEERIIDPNVKYLEAGDILVYMNLKPSISGGLEEEEREVISWRVLVYLGDNTLASLNSDKQMVKVTGNAAVVEALSYDMFLVLRPSQAYADINSDVAVYTDTAPTLGAEDMLVSRKAPLGTPLGETAKASIANLVAEYRLIEGRKWKSANLTFATEVYAAVNLDVYTDGINGKSYANLLLNCFVEKTNWFGWSQGFVLADVAPEGYEGLHEMITHYGGAEFYQYAGADLTSLNALEIGDVIVMGNRSYSAYLTAVYQGEGKFLVARRQWPDVVGDETGVQQTNTYAQETVTDISAFLGQYINEEVNRSKKYTGYVVLRPSKAYDDLNQNAVREMLDDPLTEAEKNILANLDEDDWVYGGRYLSLSGFVGWAYKSAGVEMVTILQDKTVTSARNSRFIESGGRVYLNTPLHAAYDPYYVAMMLPGLNGGSLFGENAGRMLSAEELEVGDIFAAAKKDPDAAGEYVYRVALYQGNGQFLIAQWNYRSEGKAWISTTEIIGEDYSDWLYYYVLRPDNVHTEFLLQDATLYLGAEQDIRTIFGEMPGKGMPSQWESSDPTVAKVENGELVVVGTGVCTITATGETDTASCTIRVVREITTGALTEDEMAIISGLGKDVFTTYTSGPVINAIYNAADIDLEPVYGNYGASDLFKVVKGTKEDANILLTYMKDSYFGPESINKGTKTFTPVDFKVGDILVANYKCANTEKNHWPTITVVYQGDGKFLAVRHEGMAGCKTCDDVVYFDVYDAEGNHNAEGHRSIWGTQKDATNDEGGKWLNYMVLRPERLAADAVQSITISEDTLQLHRQSAAELSFTGALSSGDASVDASKAIWKSSNDAVATVDANGKVTGISGGTAVITVYYEGYSASCEVTVDSKRLITSGALTQAEMEAISNLTSLTTVGKNPGYAAEEIYRIVGIDISSLISNQSFNDLYDAVTAGEESDYTRMLLAGYTGGSNLDKYPSFTPEGLKIGDLIIAYASQHCATCAATNTLIGVYIGDGEILMVPKAVRTADGCATKDGCYVDSYADGNGDAYSIWGGKKNFTKYFVLRPERLAPDAVQSVSLNKVALTLNYFTSEDLILTGLLGDGTEVELDASKATWTSSNTAYATVDANGKVTAVSAGTATITVCYEGYTATCSVTVAMRSITSGALTQAEMDAFAPFDVSANTFGYVAGDAYALVGISDVRNQLKSINTNNLMKALFGSDTSTELLAYNDVSEANKVYHDMLIPGFYGGSNVKTGKTFDPEDLKPGDIFGGVAKVACDHRTSSFNTVTAVYLGNDTFYVTSQYCESCYYLDAKGKTNDVGATNGYSTVSLWTDDATELESVYKYYFVLRPERLAPDAVQSVSLNRDALTLNYFTSEELTLKGLLGDGTEVELDASKATWTSSTPAIATVDANGKVTAVSAGTATITVCYEGYTATCSVTVAKRSITSGALTQAEMEAISNLTSLTTVGKNPGNVAEEIYRIVGIDISSLISNQSFNALYAAVTAGEESDYTRMLLAGYTGGSDLRTYPSFTPEDLKIGDLIIAYASQHCAACAANNTLTGVYIGDGEILMAPKTVRTADGCATKDGCYVDSYADGNGDAYSIWGGKTNFTKYFVLRPERLAADALQGITLSDDGMNVALNKSATLSVTKDPASAAPNAPITWVSSNPDVATVDANGVVTAHAIGRATITAYCDGNSDSCVIAVVGRDIVDGALTQAEIDVLKNYTTEKSATISPFIKDVYAAAEIDMTPAIGTDSWFTIRGYLYDNSGNALEGTTNFHKMVMEGYCGGKDSDSARTFQPEDFKIGDIFAGAHETGCMASGTEKKWVYVTGVYVGDGKFVVSESHPAACPDTCGESYVDTYGDENSAIWADEDYMKSVYKFYFVLRPERLAADALQGISLNEAELNLAQNETANLITTKTPADAAAEAAIVWVSSNPAVATVVDGKVTAVGVGEATITAYVNGNSASCAVAVTARSITSGVLTQAEMDAIGRLAPEDLESLANLNPGPVASKVYEVVGIQVNDVFGLLGFSAIRQNLFNNTTGALLSENKVDDTRFLTMLVPGYYGGSKYKETTQTNGKNFAAADLKIGDLFVAYGSAVCAHNNGTNTVTGVYIGDGKFLMASRNTSCENCRGYYIDAIVSAECVDKPDSVTSVWASGDVLNAGYAFYAILRPERLAVDALLSVSMSETELNLNYDTANSLPANNAVSLTYTKSAASAADPVSVVWSTSNPDVATVDQNGNVTIVGAGECTIAVICDGNKATCEVTVTRTADARGDLTVTEQTALQAFSAETISVFADFSKNAYASAGIDISAVFARYGFYDLARKNFDVDNELGGGKYALIDAVTEEQRNFREMLMYAYYGGSNISTGKAFTESDFEIGDLFFAVRKCAVSGNNGLYIVGIYQGEGRFLVYEQHPNSCKETCRKSFVDERGVTAAEDTVVWGTSTAMKNNLQFYFVLRPSRLAMRMLEDGEMTQVEQDKIAAYVRDTQGGTLSQVVNEVYAQAGIVADYVFEKASVGDARSALISEKNDETVGLLIEGTTVWHQMLVDGFYGGAYNAMSTAPTNKTFVPTELQIGDIFCGITKCVTENEDGTKTTTWPATTAIYVGNGKFVVSVHASCDCKATYIDDIAEMIDGMTPDGHTSIWATNTVQIDGEETLALNGAWLHYFILRPSQLAQ